VHGVRGARSELAQSYCAVEVPRNTHRQRASYHATGRAVSVTSHVAVFTWLELRFRVRASKSGLGPVLLGKRLREKRSCGRSPLFLHNITIIIIMSALPAPIFCESWEGLQCVVKTFVRWRLFSLRCICWLSSVAVGGTQNASHGESQSWSDHSIGLPELFGHFDAF